MRSALVAPPERLSRSRNLAVLLPWRLLGTFLRDFADFAAVFDFFARAACLADLPLDGATWRACAPTRGFFAGLGLPDGVFCSTLAAFSGTTFILISPLAVITATITSIPLVPSDCKQILQVVADGRTRNKIRAENATGDYRA